MVLPRGGGVVLILFVKSKIGCYYVYVSLNYLCGAPAGIRTRDLRLERPECLAGLHHRSTGSYWGRGVYKCWLRDLKSGPEADDCPADEGEAADGGHHGSVLVDYVCGLDREEVEDGVDGGEVDGDLEHPEEPEYVYDDDEEAHGGGDGLVELADHVSNDEADEGSLAGDVDEGFVGSQGHGCIWVLVVYEG
jgi:hypothetical protein